MFAAVRRRYLDLLASIYIYNEHRGYSSLDRVLDAVKYRYPDETGFIAEVEKHRADERKHYVMFKRYFELRGYMPYRVDRTCGHIDRLIRLTFGCHIDQLDTRRNHMPGRAVPEALPDHHAHRDTRHAHGRYLAPLLRGQGGPGADQDFPGHRAGRAVALDALYGLAQRGMAARCRRSASGSPTPASISASSAPSSPCLFFNPRLRRRSRLAGRVRSCRLAHGGGRGMSGTRVAAHADSAARRLARSSHRGSDQYLVRPPRRAAASACRRCVCASPPTSLSLAGLAFGIGAAFAYLHWPDWRMASLGFVLCVAWLIADGMDGMVARATGSTSAAGRILDGICDHAVFPFLYLFLAWSIELVHCWLASPRVAHAFQSTLYESERGRFHRRIRGDPRRQAAAFALSAGPALRAVAGSLDRMAEPLDREIEHAERKAGDRRQYGRRAAPMLRMMACSATICG